MSPRPVDPPALLRGGAAGALTAALALAAHASAGGAVPSGAAAVLLTLLSAGLGAVAGSAGRVADPRTLIGLLAGGQIIGHVTLTATGHSHVESLSAAMLSTHVSALLIGALLITGAERLCRVLSTAVRACTMPRPWVAVAAHRAVVSRTHQPLQSRLLIAVSISHRGPPVVLR